MAPSTIKDEKDNWPPIPQLFCKGKYKYELVYSADSEVLPDDIFDLWFKEVSEG